VASGEIGPRKHKQTEPGIPAPPAPSAGGTSPGPKGKAAGAIDGARAPDETTDPGVQTPLPGSVELPLPPQPRAATPPPVPPVPPTRPSTPSTPHADEARGAILGIGTGAIGGRGDEVSGEIPTKIAPGQRVLVPGPNGLMQSATVRQLLQGYYELEVGSSGQTIWVPISGVVPE
jgi:hypothetical protein